MGWNWKTGSDEPIWSQGCSLGCWIVLIILFYLIFIAPSQAAALLGWF